MKEAENEKQQLSTSLKVSADRCEELLEELNQMNKALRERGEKISRLEAAHQEKSRELESTSTCLKELQNKVRGNELTFHYHWDVCHFIYSFTNIIGVHCCCR